MPGELILYESRAPQLWQPGCAAMNPTVENAPGGAPRAREPLRAAHAATVYHR